MSDYLTARAQTRAMQKAAIASRPAAPQLPAPPQLLALPPPPATRDDMELDSNRGLAPRRSAPATAAGDVSAAGAGVERASKVQRIAGAQSDPADVVTQDARIAVIYDKVGQLDAISAALQQLTASNATLTAEVRAFKAEVQALQAKLALQDKEVKSLKTQVAAQSTEVQQLRKDLDQEVLLRNTQLDDSLHARAAQYAALEEQRAPKVAAVAKQVVLTPHRPRGAPQPDLVRFGEHTLESVAQVLAVQPTQIHSIAKIRARPEGAGADLAADSTSQPWRTGQPCSRIEVHFKHAEQKRVAMLAATRQTIRDSHSIQVQDQLLPVELREKAQLNAAAYEPLKAAGIKFSWRRSRITWWVERPAAEGGDGAWALLSVLEAPEGTSPATVKRAAELAAARALAAPRRSRRPGAAAGASGSAGRPGRAQAA